MWALNFIARHFMRRIFLVFTIFLESVTRELRIGNHSLGATTLYFTWSAYLPELTLWHDHSNEENESKKGFKATESMSTILTKVLVLISHINIVLYLFAFCSNKNRTQTVDGTSKIPIIPTLVHILPHSQVTFLRKFSTLTRCDATIMICLFAFQFCVNSMCFIDIRSTM